jgi:hypothetical protein
MPAIGDGATDAIAGKARSYKDWGSSRARNKDRR